jgi:hypothetical protein
LPLLLLLALLLLVPLLWAVSLPFLLWARYRNGSARRRAYGWVIRMNAWLLALSVPLLGVSAWATSHWVPDAMLETVAGLMLGVLLGIASLWLTRFEHDATGFHFTPNRWLVLGLTALVATRIVVGLVVSWRQMGDAHPSAIALLDAGALLALAGLFLGYALAYAWGLRARLPRVAPAAR